MLQRRLPRTDAPGAPLLRTSPPCAPASCTTEQPDRTPPSAGSPKPSGLPTEPPASPVAFNPLRQAMRTQAMVVGFYLVDALLMAAYAAHGTLPPLAAVAYGVAGCGLTGLFAVVVHLGLHRRLGGARFTTLQLLTACSLMLITAAMVPQIGMLLMMTMIVAVATAALQLPLKHVLAVSGAIAAASLALLLMHGNRFGMPVDDGLSRLVSGLWFTVILGKIAAIHLIGARMRKALSASNAQLTLALNQVRELSERDELTGLRNRRSILTLLAEERARFARGGVPFAVALLDIDHFKRVNDQYGHAKGDEVLRTFADIVGGSLRSIDRIARFGGEEFLLLLPNITEARLAVLAADRFRRAVETHPWANLAPELAVTCSIGVTMSGSGESVAEMLERADAALYRAKSEGRNLVRAD